MLFQKARLARRREKLADPVHGPVLYLLLKQNRELAYASESQGKPSKGLQKSCCLVSR